MTQCHGLTSCNIWDECFRPSRYQSCVMTPFSVAADRRTSRSYWSISHRCLSVYVGVSCREGWTAKEAVNVPVLGGF